MCAERGRPAKLFKRIKVLAFWASRLVRGRSSNRLNNNDASSSCYLLYALSVDGVMVDSVTSLRNLGIYNTIQYNFID